LIKYSSQLAAFATFLCSICPVKGHCISVQLTGTMVAPKQKKIHHIEANIDSLKYFLGKEKLICKTIFHNAVT